MFTGIARRVVVHASAVSTSKLMDFVAVARRMCLLIRPCGPAASVSGDIEQTDAIHWANRQTKRATRAMRLDDAVHGLVAAENGVSGANRKAQGASDAPCFVDDSHRTARFDTVLGIKRQRALPGDDCEPGNTLGTAGRTLVDRGSAVCNRVRVGGAVRVSATRALRLGQRGVKALKKGGEGRRIHPAIVTPTSRSAPKTLRNKGGDLQAKAT